MNVCLGRCMAGVWAWGSLLLFVETRWSDHNVGLLRLMCGKVCGRRLRGGVLENKCSCRICGQLVADSGVGKGVSGGSVKSLGAESGSRR